MTKFLLLLFISLSVSAGLYTPPPNYLTILTATSSAKTPTASNNYNAMTTNSLALTAGVWDLGCGVVNADSGGASGLSFVGVSIYGANGADSASAPTLLSATSNLTINSLYPADGLLYSMSTATASTRLNNVARATVTTTATVTVYCVPVVTVTTAANSRLTTYFTGRKLY